MFRLSFLFFFLSRVWGLGFEGLGFRFWVRGAGTCEYRDVIGVLHRGYDQDPLPRSPS